MSTSHRSRVRTGRRSSRYDILGALVVIGIAIYWLTLTIASVGVA